MLTRNRSHTCAICLQEGADLFTNGCSPPGRHFFCRACIDRWIDAEGQNTCPTCKQEFDQLLTQQGMVVRRSIKSRLDDEPPPFTDVERQIIDLVHQAMQALQHRDRSDGVNRVYLRVGVR